MATITVTTIADRGTGSLRQAIASAQSGDIIRFAPALANRVVTLTSGPLTIPAGKQLTIDGSAAPNLAISGNRATRIFQVESTSATPSRLTLKHLTLQDGYTRDRGGAISTEHQAVLVIQRVTFKANVADQGGGAIFSAFEGALTVTDSRFVGNRATAGNDERGAGAIAFWGPGPLTVRDSQFINNHGINGGAINSLNGKLSIDRTLFQGNTTTAGRYDTGEANPFLRGFGGALYTDRASSVNEAAGSIQITRSQFIGNQGRGEGGAAYLYTGTQDRVVIQTSVFQGNRVRELPNGGNNGNGGALVVISNGLNRGLTLDGTTFANNTASGQGGGLWMMDAPTLIRNSTFSGNRVLGTSSSTVGGGMALYGPTQLLNTTLANNFAGWVGGGVAANSDRVTVKNSIFYNNTADNGTNNWGIQQHTSRELIDLGGNIQWPIKLTNNWNDYNATATIRIVDPKLGPLRHNGGFGLTHALLTGSPAINRAVAGAPGVDQRGTRRDSTPDSGAFEFLAGAFVLVGTEDADGLQGSAGGDRLLGQEGADTLTGGAGNDTLTGGAGNDLLEGGSGVDRLVGEAGNDGLIGGVGADVITGGTGGDRLIYTSLGDRGDRMTDFNPAADRIDLRAVFQGSAFSSSNPFRDYLRVVSSGANTVVQIDSAGDAGTQFRPLVTLNNVTASRVTASAFLL